MTWAAGAGGNGNVVPYLPSLRTSAMDAGPGRDDSRTFGYMIMFRRKMERLFFLFNICDYSTMRIHLGRVNCDMNIDIFY